MSVGVFRSHLRDRLQHGAATAFDAAGAAMISLADGTICGKLPRRTGPCRSRSRVRKLIEFDDDTFAKLKQLGRDRMATIQELADEAFTDLLKKHGIPIDLKDALRKSASADAKAPAKKAATKKR
jgi:hypothetical protein